MDDLTNAKKILADGNFTAVLCRDGVIHTSILRGVKPLVIWVQNGYDFSGYSAADKVVGKATAFLYLHLGVKAVYANIISKPALQVLTGEDVVVEYTTLVENIINRQGNGICPFEELVIQMTDTKEAYQAICEKMVQMNI